MNGFFHFLVRVISVSRFTSRLHLEFPSLKFLSTKPDRYQKFGMFNRCKGKCEVAWIRRPRFVLGISTESPVQHIYVGPQDLGAQSEGALLEGQNGLILVFYME